MIGEAEARLARLRAGIAELDMASDAETAAEALTPGANA